MDIIKHNHNEELEAYKTEICKLTIKVEELEELFKSNEISNNDKVNQLVENNPLIKDIINSTDLDSKPSRHLTTEQQTIIALMLNLRSTTTQLKLSEIEIRNLKRTNDDWCNAYLKWKKDLEDLQKSNFNLELQSVRDKASIEELTKRFENLTTQPFFYNYLPNVSFMADNAIWSVAIGFLALFNLFALIKSVKIFIFSFFSSLILIALKLFFPQKDNNWIFKTAFYSCLSISTFLIGIDLIRKFLIIRSKKELEKDEIDKGIIDIEVLENNN